MYKTIIQRATESACAKCPMEEPGCRSLCPVFRRALNKEKNAKKAKSMKPEISTETDVVVILCEKVQEAGRDIIAYGGGKTRFVCADPKTNAEKYALWKEIISEAQKVTKMGGGRTVIALKGERNTAV